MLELGREPITEREFRAGIRTFDRGEVLHMEELREFTYLSEYEKTAANDAVAFAVDLIAGNTATRTEPAPADIERAADIVREECARWKNI